MPHGHGAAPTQATQGAGADGLDFEQFLDLNADDLGILASSPESSALLRSIEMDITPSSFLSDLPQPAVEDVSYIHTLPPELLAPFQQATPASSHVPLPPHHPPQYQHVLAPTHFSPRILPSGASSVNASATSLFSCQPPQAPSPLGDHLMIPPQEPIHQPAFISAPWAPFWTAAPLPFNPQTYPQNIIPAHTEVPLCPPSSNPRAKIFAQRQTPSVVPAAADPVAVPAPAPRPEKKRSAVKDPAKSALLNQLQELQNRLLSSESESSVLREKLNMTQQELAKQKAFLQARNSPMATPPPTPEEFADPSPVDSRAGSPPRAGSPTRTNANDIYNTASPFKTRTSKSIPAFTEKIDFANIELKKTSSSRVLEAEKTSYVEAQTQWQQRLATGAPLPAPSQPISINPRMLHRC